MNKIAAAIGFAAAVSVTAPVMADTNRALEAWKAFAAEQNNPNYDKWVSLISDPKAIALAKEWKDLRGYDAYDLMDKAEFPAELKAGLVINAANKANFPWLQDYLPKEYMMLLAVIGFDWCKLKSLPNKHVLYAYRLLSGLQRVKGEKYYTCNYRIW